LKAVAVILAGERMGRGGRRDPPLEWRLMEGLGEARRRLSRHRRRLKSDIWAVGQLYSILSEAIEPATYHYNGISWGSF
jgi:hypothetical protein